MSSYDEFQRTVGEAMFRFQMLEEVLKDYLAEANKHANEALDPVVPFLATRDRYERMPLGQLVREFSHHTRRKKLLHTLTLLARDRNTVAHKVFVLILSNLKPVPGQPPRYINWAEEVANLSKVAISAFMAFDDVYLELQIARRELLPTARPTES